MSQVVKMIMRDRNEVWQKSSSELMIGIGILRGQ